MVRSVYLIHLLKKYSQAILKSYLLLTCFCLISCLKPAEEGLPQKVSYSKLEIYPSLQTIAAGKSQLFYGINGVPPYTYSISVGTGSIDSSTGLYLSGNSTGTGVVKVMDSVGQEAVALVFIVDQLTISPTNVNVTAGGNISFSSFGGSPPYTYDITLGNGTVDPLTGLFTAADSPGTTIVEVTDKNGTKLSAVVTTVEKPHINPPLAIVEAKDQLNFSTLGGVEPYTYSIFSGSGTISASGLFTAPATTGTTMIEVRDKYGFNSFSQVQIINSNKIAANLGAVCAYIGSTKAIKCWGRNDSGQLGIGGTQNIGDNSYEMGVSLDAIDFGYGGAVDPQDIFAGSEHFCAFMENTDIKCWGKNTFGQLGLGDSLNRGDDELLTAISPVSFGLINIKATHLSSGANHNCVLFENNQIKCWGRNDYGQLGLEAIDNKGDNAAEMGTNLTYVDLGTIDPIKTIKSGSDHNCVLTTTSKVKCWGRNDFGQLGLGNSNHRGDAAGEMGDSLPFLDFGDLGSLSIIDLSLGANHTCALFSDGTAKCWGLNDYGQLGLGDNLTRGTSVAQTPANLAVIDVGTFFIKTLYAGFSQTCGIDADGLLKCWGKNNSAQLGQSFGSHLGDNAGEMGLSLATINLGSIAKARSVAIGDEHTCVVLTDGRIKCFGSNFYGQIGLERTYSPYDIIGDLLGEMGDYLSPINL